MLIINLFLYVLAIIILIPSLVLLIECLTAVILTPPPWEIETNPHFIFAVLIPAHNEATGIEQTLLNLLSQVKDAQNILVVADNCTDLTAEIARQKGVSVIERSNLTERGKGYALDYGLQHLASSSSPDVVVLIDADCQVSPGTIENITQLAWYKKRPVQVTYLMEKPHQPSPKDLISTLAFLVKNKVRMLGLTSLRLPCPLQGAGMAFPMSLVQEISLKSGNIVEDMQLGIDLAIKGHFGIFYPQGQVTSVLPSETKVAKTQRTRWEHGHLNTLITQIPRLLKGAIVERRLALLALALDLAIPPLSFLVLLWVLVTLVGLLGVILGFSWIPLILLAIAGLSILLSIFLSWVKFARKDIPLGSLLTIPLYLLWKVPIYLAFLLHREQKWIRTERK